MQLLWILLVGIAFTQGMPTGFPEDEDHTLRWQDSREGPAVFDAELSTGLPESAETLPSFTTVERQDLTTVNEELILTSPLPNAETLPAVTSTTPKSLKSPSNMRASPTPRRKETPEKQKVDPTTTTTKPSAGKTISSSFGKQSSFGSSASPSRESSTATTTTASKKNSFDEEESGSQRGKNENLADFLKRRKQERFLATTEADPFAAFFAKGSTTTRPSAKQTTTTTAATTSENSAFSSSGRSLSAPNKIRPGGSRSTASFGRSRQSQSSFSATTSTTTTERSTQTTQSRSRFTGFPRNTNKAARGATSTPDTLVIDKPEPVIETSTKAKSFTKRPSAFRPVPNSISRRRDQTSTAASVSETPETVADSPVDEVPKAGTRRAGTRRLRGNRL